MLGAIKKMKTGNLEKDEGNTLEMMITLKKRNQKIVIKSLEKIEFKMSYKMFKKFVLYFATLFTILVTTVIVFPYKTKLAYICSRLFIPFESIFQSISTIQGSELSKLKCPCHILLS